MEVERRSFSLSIRDFGLQQSPREITRDVGASRKNDLVMLFVCEAHIFSIYLSTSQPLKISMKKTGVL